MFEAVEEADEDDEGFGVSGDSFAEVFTIGGA